MKCPACPGTMAPEQAADTVVDRCGGCGSVWFDATELDRQLQVHAVTGCTETEIPDYGMSGRLCPRCYPRALRLAGWHDLRFDRCPRCHGIFVEPGELEALSARPMRADDVTGDVQSFAVTLGYRLLLMNGYAWIIIRVVQALRR